MRICDKKSCDKEAEFDAVFDEFNSTVGHHVRDNKVVYSSKHPIELCHDHFFEFKGTLKEKKEKG